MNPWRILIVEDEAIAAMDIRDRLAAMGYAVAGRTTVEKALASVEKEHPDLVLMDIGLQGDTDRIAAAREIHRRFHLPVIFLFACSEDATLDHTGLDEPFGYIFKPFDDREIKSVIEIALCKHHAEEEIRRLNRFYDVLSQVNQTILRLRTREELLPTVCRLVVERGAIDLAWIGWIDPDTFRIVPVAQYGARTEALRAADFSADVGLQGQGIPGKAGRVGRSFVCNRCRTEEGLCPSWPAPAECGFQSCGSFPLRMRGELCGTLNLCVTKPAFFHEGEIRLLEEVAADVSFALDRIEDDALHGRAEGALRESEEQYRIVTEHSMDGITIVKDNALAYVNRRLCAMFGYDGPEDLVGRSPLTLVHPDDTDEAEKRAQARLSGADVQLRHLFRGVTRDGRMLYIELSATLITYRGGPATLAYHRDVTGRKKLEDQLRQAQKLEGIGQLAGGIAHDFNNLLTVISGFATILRMGLKENETQRAHVDQILSASEKAANLTESLLAFSRKQAINPKPSDLNELVKRAKKFLSRIIGEDIELHTTLIDGELIAMIDENQLDHVILNMAANARDAMPEGGLLSIDTGEVMMDDQFIGTHGYGKPGLYASISVSDSGVGMDGETKGRVFEPFFTTKGMGRGTGLGLSMVYGIVKQHNGYISVESEPGEGTTFTIYLPRTRPGRVEAFQTAPVPLPGGTETILLVEDEADVRAYVKLVLQKYGYRVIETRDGEDALEQFARHKDSVDLCILDVIMPKMNGKEVYLRLKALKPDVSVFFMSGYADDILKQKGFEGDEFNIIAKPIRLTRFLTRIREALDRSVAPAREGEARQQVP